MWNGWGVDVGDREVSAVAFLRLLTRGLNWSDMMRMSVEPAAGPPSTVQGTLRASSPKRGGQ